MDLEEYRGIFDRAEERFESDVEAFGVDFEASETQPRDARSKVAVACGCHCENAGFSLWGNWISPACLACRTGEETATFFIDLNCTKHCYFCFNPNQEYYGYCLKHKRDIVGELEELHARGEKYQFLAITGGEPMLYRDEVVAFLQRARSLYPEVHIRLYTSGDMLDAAGLRELAEAGLSEIRFSVKPLETDGSQERVYGLMEQAVGLIPHTVIEVPVIPGSLGEMKAMLLRANDIGVTGVNLLEFCFPLHNGQEFARRGFKLRKHPYRYLYDYWYGGGIPVAGSESEALQLLEFASQEGLKIGVHYCSSDNKNTGQIFQQNKAFFGPAGFAEDCPWITADEGDRFLKCLKAFGTDAKRIREWAKANSLYPYNYDPSVPSIELPLSRAAVLREALPDVRFGTSVAVVEQVDSTPPALSLREIAVE